MDIRKLVRPNVRSLRAYHAKQIPCMVKLDANESPYGFRALKSVETNRYPDPQAKSLRELIATDCKVKPENILCGNGSDELIYYLITTFGGPVLYPVPTFSMYGIISQALNQKKIEIPLDGKFDLAIEKMLQAIKRHRPKLIFLSSPNNPTGNCFTAEKILKIIRATSKLQTPDSRLALVVVDEAYQPFSGKNGFLPLLGKFKNLVIMRTLSKIGLAALRLGYLTADDEIIGEVNRVRLPFNVNSLSQAVAIDALRNKRKMRSNITSVVSERKRLFNAMKKISAVTPYPSDANFILFKVMQADGIYEGLLKKGILVRNLSEIIDNCLRVTVGTPRENALLLKALRELL